MKTTISGSKGLTVEIVTVTPAVADTFLRTNRKNRRRRAARVKYLAAVMRRGEWVLAQPLLFNCDGTMIDGQHRCLAVIEANVPVKFIVIRGFDPEKTFGKIDDTDARKLQDWLQQENVMLPDVTASVVRMTHRYENGWNAFTSGGGIRLSGPAGLEFLKSHAEIRQAVVEGPGTVNTLIPRSMACFLYMLFRKSDKALADVFFLDLIADRTRGPGDPVIMLRERLLRDRYDKKSKLTRVEKAALIIKAWNAEKNKIDLKSLKWTSSGPTVEPFPSVQ